MPAATAWPLVGRNEEVEYLLGALRRARGVLIVGDAGVGKSRLAAEVSDRATTSWTVVRVAAVESASVPFASFASLLPRGTGVDPLERVVAIADAVVARGKRVLVAIDDAQHLDEMSVVLVHHLVSATDVRLLMTARSGLPIAEPIAALVREGVLDRLEVHELSIEEVTSLVGASLGGPVDGSIGRRIWERTRGNPLFTREVVLDAVERGDLERTADGWRLRESPPGRRVQDVLASRLGSVEAAELDVLGLLAVGEPLGVTMLENLTTTSAVANVERRGLVRTERSERREEVRLAHPLYGEVLRATSGPGTLRSWRRALIEATPGRRRDDRLRVAVLQCDAGEVADVDALVESARDLEAAYHRAAIGGVTAVVPGYLAAASRLARIALDHGGGVSAAEVLVRALSRLGLHDDAGDVLLDLGRLVVDDASAVAVARLRADAMQAIGDADGAISLLVEAEEAMADDELRRLLRVERVQIEVLVGRFEDAVRTAESVRPFEGPTLAAAGAYGMALVRLGRSLDALSVVEPILAAIDGTQSPKDIVGCLYARLGALTNGGRVDDSLAFARLLLSITEPSGDEEQIAVMRTALGMTLVDGGAMATAAALLDDAIAGFARADSLGLRSGALASSGHAHALLGHHDVAAERIATLDTVERSSSFDGDIDRGRAFVLAASGRVDDAVRHLVDAAAAQRAAGVVAEEISLLHDVIRLGRPDLVVDRVTELAPIIQGPVGELAADHARALLDRDGIALADVGERLAACGFNLMALDALAQAESVHAAAGEKASAAACRRRANELAERCEGATTPATRAVGAGAVLSKREREVAELAARGMTDREIADALSIGIRTVESHLSHVYVKIGATSRRELATLLA